MQRVIISYFSYTQLQTIDRVSFRSVGDDVPYVEMSSTPSSAGQSMSDVNANIHDTSYEFGTSHRGRNRCNSFRIVAVMVLVVASIILIAVITGLTLKGRNKNAEITSFQSYSSLYLDLPFKIFSYHKKMRQ